MKMSNLILSCIVSAALTQGYAQAKGLDNTWFQGQASNCDSYVDADLKLKDAPPVQIPMLPDIPQSLNKSGVEGLGKCCLFDQGGNLIEAKYKIVSGKRVRVSGSGLVTNGNDECGQWLRNEIKIRRNAKAAGLYWCVGPVRNCHMDWWRIKP